MKLKMLSNKIKLVFIFIFMQGCLDQPIVDDCDNSILISFSCQGLVTKNYILDYENDIYLCFKEIQREQKCKKKRNERVYIY